MILRKEVSPIPALLISIFIWLSVVGSAASEVTTQASELCANGLQLLSELPDHIPPTSSSSVQLKTYGLTQILDWASRSVTGYSIGPTKRTRKLPITALRNYEDIRTAGLTQLREAARLGNNTAKATLAETYLFGKYLVPTNFTRSLDLYEQLAVNGDASAQFMCGVFYSTGMFGTVEPDQTKASLYYELSARGGDINGNMATAFRHLAGIAGYMSSAQALPYYQAAAHIAYTHLQPTPEEFLSFQVLSNNEISIPEEATGGIYGSGVGESGSDKKSLVLTRDNYLDTLEYLNFLGEAKDMTSLNALYKLAWIYYDGSKFVNPDHEASLSYALECASIVWTPDGRLKKGIDKENQNVIDYGGACAAIIGQFYARGEIVEKEPLTALNWFKRGAMLDNPTAMNLYGLIHLYGDGIERNENIAVTECSRAAAKGSKLADLSVGKMLLANGFTEKGYQRIEKAAESNSLEAIYIHANHLADLAKKPDGSIVSDLADRACSYLKHFVERVEDMKSYLGWAHDKYLEGDYQSAIIGYLIAAEQGYLTAQSNLAFLLDNQGGYIDLRRPEVKKRYDLNESLSTALLYWGRSAKQHSHDALIKMGDYYLSGKGTEVDPSKAFSCYKQASNKASGLANWNLGWMHENGIGVEKDYHLAKRYYDLAMISEPYAYFPVRLSLVKLYIKSYWNDITGGKIKSMMDESLASPKVSLQEGWSKMWTAWKEMDFKIWDDEGLEEDILSSGSEVDDSYGDDFLDFFLIVILVALIVFLFIRQQARRREAARNGAGNGNENANRPRVQMNFGIGFFGLNVVLGDGGFVAM